MIQLFVRSALVKICVELVAKRFTGIVESKLLVNPINLLPILRRELEVNFQVRLDARGGLRFGKDRVTLCNTPRERHLRTGLVVFLADFDEDRIIL